MMKRIALAVIPLIAAAIARELIKRWVAKSESEPGAGTAPVSTPS